MANWMKLLGQIVLSAFCFYIIALESVEARGARGGRFGGRYRSSRYRSGSRITRMSSTRKAIIAGTIFGAASYRRRRRYLSSPDSDPTVCHNSQYVGNGTVFYYGKFLCPMDGQPDDFAYCCGPEGSQRCCEFFDDPGRTAGVVIGVLIAAVALGVFIFFCVCKTKMKKSPGQVISSFRHRNRHDAVGYNAAPPQPHTMTYPVQPKQGLIEPNGVMQPPPSYDAATENQQLPYGMNPDSGYKQPLPIGDFSTEGPTPYAINPTVPGTDASYPGQGYPAQPYPPPQPGQTTGYPAQPYPPPPAGQDAGYPAQPYPPVGNGYQPYGQQ